MTLFSRKRGGITCIAIEITLGPTKWTFSMKEKEKEREKIIFIEKDYIPLQSWVGFFYYSICYLLADLLQ